MGVFFESDCIIILIIIYIIFCVCWESEWNAVEEDAHVAGLGHGAEAEAFGVGVVRVAAEVHDVLGPLLRRVLVHPVRTLDGTEVQLTRKLLSYLIALRLLPAQSNLLQLHAEHTRAGLVQLEVLSEEVPLQDLLQLEQMGPGRTVPIKISL